MLDVFKEKFAAQGFTEPSPIQMAVESPMLAGTSVLGLAPTGSGKTLAFTWPMLEKIQVGEGTQALILAPSQELAMQTTGVVREWAQLIDAKVLALTGGANVKRQMEKLKKHPEIIVGTPGRVTNLIDTGKLKLGHLELMIIDEADELLTDETLDQIREILDATFAESLQLGFFSATKTEILDELPRWFGQNVEKIDVRDIDQTQGEVRHRTMEVGNRHRVDLLKRISRVDRLRALVFFNKMQELQHVVVELRHQHVSFAALTSNQRQVDREKALRLFRQGKVELLLTTDLAARGLDVPELPAVINFQLPKDVTTYIHRSGRTGRMGADGLVIIMGDDHDIRDFKKMMKSTDYDVKPGYLAGYQIVDTKPAKVKPTLTFDHPTHGTEATGARHRVAGLGHPDSVREVPTEKPVQKPTFEAKPKRKKSHNKHSKKKGMRKKNRDRSTEK
ncbi:DEAD/DEAH box helicase [Lactiplantibacillus mudanjiangensis]|uniref:ATP-dependent RNA helicase [Lactobacillus plantarum JDM1] n=1 Tax=Lactiplantibacillus mudanjiangensis TaxID=1296538 RepID=A0A660E8Y9_9LACO|nr:DEAD/DEAH box helicase [Lactiplantibacillus mudanjiangensis]VDG23142.1 ATP-dependent RNA helicase [Lactobacillus plantarum JDM1] [Lactiplantibacillus mudanjiangensis]VDG29591.1 ATP-dependent RNA helicase [Lactobacillus plantarum JDM1] [Lactiplantibacillus mudanjiangensis]